MNINQTDLFVEVLLEVMENPVPGDVLVQAKKCLLDYLGVCLAGSKMIGDGERRYLDAISTERTGCSTIIGHGIRSSLQNAAFVNGLSSHAAELDDGHRFGMIHPGGPVISALLAVAEKEGLSGRDLLRGIVTGYECAIRLACAVQPDHKLRGYHATGTCGLVAAGVAVAAALGYDKKKLKDTISAAATSAGGLLEVIGDASELKPFNIAHAAQDGLTAAYMALAGFAGPEDVLGGKRGFFSAISGNTDTERLTRRSRVHEIMSIYMKPYAACRHCHPAIEASLTLKALHDLEHDTINSIMIETYQLAVLDHDHTSIQGITSAKMSIPFSVAVALETGGAGIEGFTREYIDSERIRNLMSKMTVREVPELTALVPQKRAAKVTLKLQDGQTVTERVDFPRGEPENPITLEDAKDKFISLAIYGGKKPDEASELMQYIMNVETELDNLYPLL